MKRIAIVVDSDVFHDARVLKIMRSLSKKYDVVVIGFSDVRFFNKNNIILASSLVYRLSQIFINIFVGTAKETFNINFINFYKKNISYLKIKRLLLDIFRHFRLKIKISAIRKVLSKIKADIYYANDLPVLRICMTEAIRNNARLIYDSHELYLEQGFFETRFLHEKYFFQEKEGIKKADAVITVNEFIAKELSKRYNYDFNKIHVIYNYPEGHRQERFCQAEFYSTNRKEVRLLYQGGFAPGRGLKELVLAMERVPDHYKLYMRGIGSYGKYLKECAKEKGLLNNRVFFLEPVGFNKLLSEASFADVGVLFYEPYCLNNYFASPNKLFDYINIPLAILCNGLPFLKKIIDTYKVGICIDQIDPNEIAKAITQFTPENVFRYKLASFEASKILNWKTEEEKLYKIIENLFK